MEHGKRSKASCIAILTADAKKPTPWSAFPNVLT